MLIRRLYSSCSRSAPSVEAAGKHTPTRGRLRLKPSRISQSQTLSKLTRPRTNDVTNDLLKSISLQHGGRGRKGRRSWVQRSKDMAVITADRPVQIPFVAGRAVEGFTPIHLYPVQAALHLAFTPPHLPLPVNLGARMYTTPPSTDSNATPFNVDTMFTPPPTRPSPVPELSRSSENVLGDHQNVLSALAHPVNLHHLGDSSLTSTLQSLGDGDTVLARMIAEAGVKWRLSPEAEWEKTISRLSSPTSSDSKTERTDVQSSEEVKASATRSESSVNEAVTGLEALLDKLKMGDDKVDMTSVKRKRKQKISKHKYKKRRKAERAQRKRLGK